MGVQQGSRLLHTLGGLTFTQLVSLCCKRAEDAGRVGLPAVAGDISWLCDKLRKTSITNTRTYITEFVNKFISEGIIFYAAFDPDCRHHTKKATIQREFDRQYSVADCIGTKTKLLQISRILRENVYKNEEEKQILKSRLKDLEKRVKKAEKSSAEAHQHPEIVDSVQRAMEDLVGLHPGKVMIVEGKFQADSYIQHLLTAKIVDLAIGNDADFSIIAGEACLQLSSFSITVKQNRRGHEAEIKEVTVATGWSKTIEKVRGYLGNNVGNYSAADLPLLDGVTDLRTRCLIAVLFGNDTFPKELKSLTFFKNMGPAAVRDMMHRIGGNADGNISFDDLLSEALDAATQKKEALNAAAQREGASESIVLKQRQHSRLAELSRPVLKALVEAMAYEPATVAGSGDMLYSVCPPILPVDHYIEDFVSGNDITLVTNECELGTCPGPCPSHSHIFMMGEGTQQCGKCRKTFCQICVVIAGDETASTNAVCIPCLGAAADSVDPVSKMSEKKLWEALSDKIEVPADIPMADLQELYISIVEGDSMDSLDSKLFEEVQCPLYHPSVLDSNKKVLDFLARFDFRDGARFLCDRNLTCKQHCGLMNLFAHLVTFRKNKNLPKSAELLPCLLSQFASEARIDSGERLMKRCVRHALDPKTPSILHVHGSVIEHNGDIGLVIHDKISPSFKDGMYAVSSAFTASHMLANKCECKAGADIQSDAVQGTRTTNSDMGKHICVHCLPVPYKLTILLMDGLAEHALVEFSSCFGCHEENGLDEAEKAKLRMSIVTLMDAASFKIPDSLQSKSPHELLQEFSVGTERGKKMLHLPNPPDPDKLGPIRNYKRVSPEEKAKIKLTIKEEKKSAKITNVADAPNTLPDPDYLTMSRLCHTFAKVLDSTQSFEETMIVGYCLLDLHAKKVGATDATISLVDAGLNSRVMEMFDAAKTREDPRTRAAKAKRKLAIECSEESEVQQQVKRKATMAPANKITSSIKEHLSLLLPKLHKQH